VPPLGMLLGANRILTRCGLAEDVGHRWVIIPVAVLKRGRGWRGRADEDAWTVGWSLWKSSLLLAHLSQPRLQPRPIGQRVVRCRYGGRSVHHLDELLAVLLGCARRSLHEEDPRHHVQEDPPHPMRHAVGLWRPVMYVQNKDGDYDGQCDEDHGEQQIFTNQRNHQRC